MGKLLTTKEAAQYLAEKGKPKEKSSLDTMRTLGGGPAFYKEEGKRLVMYDTDDLDAYIASGPQMKKYNSTSEYPETMRKRRKKSSE
jgi:hypothetical protein